MSRGTRNGVILAAILVGLLVVGGLVVWQVRRRRRERAEEPVPTDDGPSASA